MLTKIEPFYIVGISVKTTNQNNQALKDISALWAKFLSQEIATLIPNKLEDSIYSVYLEYDKDHTAPYTTLLGCKVSHLDIIPKGMVGKVIPGGNYSKVTAKGSLEEGVIFQAWSNIWNAGLNRAYTADFEVYGEKAKDPKNAEVDIFVSVHESTL